MFLFNYLCLVRSLGLRYNRSASVEDNIDHNYPHIRDRFRHVSAGHECGVIGCGKVLIGKIQSILSMILTLAQQLTFVSEILKLRHFG